MSQPKDASGTIYAAGALLLLNGLMFLAKGKTALGAASAVIGFVLIVQRMIRNRKRGPSA